MHGTFELFQGKHAGKICYLVGKGPSLDRIDAIQGFLATGVVMCINESIHKVESLGIYPPLYVVQQDSALKEACIPKRPTTVHFMNAYQTTRESPKVVKRTDSDWNKKALLYDPCDFGRSVSTQTAIMAIEIARVMGMRDFRLIGFDSWRETPLCEYANCIGHSSGGRASKDRFTNEKHLIAKALEWAKYEVIHL